MEIENCVALVTGANRGLGRAYADALLDAGAAKVYAGARDPASITDPRLVPVKLDVTAPDDIARAADACADVNLLINNAGIMLLTPMLTDRSEAALRAELEVNVFGVLGMIRAFAPILARNGGGAIANMLSVVSWFVSPFNATYCTSKYAALAVTDAARIELAAQGTHVVGVYAGFIDTDMASAVTQEKVSPRQVAERTLEGIRTKQDHVLADQRTHDLWQSLRTNPRQIEAEMKQAWAQGSPWSTT